MISRATIFEQGESRDGTVIKLKDRCQGYAYAKKPNYLFATTDPMEPDKRPGGDDHGRESAITCITREERVVATIFPVF